MLLRIRDLIWWMSVIPAKKLKLIVMDKRICAKKKKQWKEIGEICMAIHSVR